jgi:hypothetical protein
MRSILETNFLFSTFEKQDQIIENPRFKSSSACLGDLAKLAACFSVWTLNLYVYLFVYTPVLTVW